MSTRKALLLHEDPKIRQTLRDHLRHFEAIRILGETPSAEEARELLRYIPYDVLFLGTRLEDGIDGLDFADDLHMLGACPAIVFLAGDETQAYPAFEMGAIDYLICPPPRERVARTVDRILALAPQSAESRDKVVPEPLDTQEAETLHLDLGEDEEERLIRALRQAWALSREAPLEIEKLPVNHDGRHLLIPYTRIVFVEAYEDYSFVHTAQERYLTSYRLKTLEDRLQPHGFFRVHRKYLVNLDMVTEIASLPGSNFMLRTAGKKRIELPISRRRISRLKEILQMV
ncbi:MAG TPA: LytTR family DNA-binding domain-containing protein [Desulfomicrobiaceae bacterium]|nr:LytTR family DNA-binding domain-containing protein [Desulfomicrobiaceae bacterium]